MVNFLGTDITGILRPIQRGMLEFVGFSVLTPHIVYAPVHLTEVERKHVLVTYVERLKNIAEESPIQIGSY